jgi:3-deoxy-manno-octulosonate cytidylyltransferase (CMP-KDO synthetase)
LKTIAVIPARFGASRLPGKPLALIHGKPMVQWVYESTCQARGVDEVWIATDDQRVLDSVSGFGGKALMTSSALVSGTDRVAAVADQVPGDIYINVQGDEPLIEPKTIEAALKLVTSGSFQMSSVMTRLKNKQELENLSVVKAVVDKNNRAIYFSRYPIPYSRNPAPSSPADWACFRHLGLYVYRRDTLMQLRELEPSKIELGESLEQLRAMENGISIGLSLVDSVSIGVDTPEDLEAVRKMSGEVLR